jgi:DNA polymerase III alpha subunit
MSNLLNLTEYKLPYHPNTGLHLYGRIPAGSNAVPFDIFDYEYLFHDAETLDIMRNGNTIGCFYIESPAMRSLLKRLNVETFEMLTAASSVIRPGVAESGMMQEFIARHKNPKLRKYLLPEMEIYLGETYGVMIYQEDVIKIAHHIGGLTLAEADLLRRAMSGKMRSHDAMQRLTKKFFTCCEQKGIKPYEAKELWRQIESFAGYSFCKAHSASFALLSFQVAFLKVHYPAEFMSSVLSNGGGFYSASVYIWEAKRMGLDVLLPSVNDSEYEYTGSGNTIRIGLMAIKHLSRNSIAVILKERKQHGCFNSLADFIVRTKLGSKETAMLIQAGAMDSFGNTRTTLFRLADIYFNSRVLNREYNDLFLHESLTSDMQIEATKDNDDAYRCQTEYESFDYMVTKHPLEFFDEYLDDRSLIHARDIPKYQGKKVRMIGWYMTSKRIRTKKGEFMKFLSLEDLTGTFETVIFPGVYARVAEKTISMGPYLIEGRVDADNGNNIVVEKLDLAAHRDIKSDVQYDLAENRYEPNDEGLREEDFMLAKTLDKELLIKAYAY